ncbi:MAG: response regulator [Prolixibacteraceae bacterium]|nr:response regulator [Prolixibacteraceae bacterium]
MKSKVKILVVEDEFMISEDIAMRLGDFGYDIAGIASTANRALEILEQRNTDLALLDINLDGEMDGIELAKIIQEKYKIPFIFLTSLASKTIVERARETTPWAYLLKPFNDRQVQIAIDIALQNFSENKTIDKINPQSEKSFQEENLVIPIKESLFLKKDTHFERVAFDDILYLRADNNYTFVHTKCGRYIYSTIIKAFEQKLPSSVFMRVHRSYIVNLNNVTGFEGSTLYIGNVQIPMNKSVREIIHKAFKTV